MLFDPFAVRTHRVARQIYQFYLPFDDDIDFFLSQLTHTQGLRLTVRIALIVKSKELAQLATIGYHDMI